MQFEEKSNGYDVFSDSDSRFYGWVTRTESGRWKPYSDAGVPGAYTYKTRRAAAWRLERNAS